MKTLNLFLSAIVLGSFVATAAVPPKDHKDTKECKACCKLPEKCEACCQDKGKGVECKECCFEKKK
jgi:hypothetical protein